MTKRHLIIRRSRSFRVLLVTLSIISFVLFPPVLMASSGPSHGTHWDADKGPRISLSEDRCYVCHGDKACQKFKDDEPFETTTVCNPCHSVDGMIDGVAMAKDNWGLGVYDPDAGGTTLASGMEMWCISCHDSGTSVCNGVSAPDISGDNTTYGYYVNGHRSRLCSDCHDLTVTHMDGEARTYAFNVAYYDPSESGVAYAAGYRLKSMGPDDPPGGYNESVPLMIPASASTTFSYSSQDIMDNAFRLCFSCHDSTKIFDDNAEGGLDTNFKAALPDPPQSYSYTWSPDEDTNQHLYHIVGATMQLWDSDWDTGTSQGVGEGNDSLVACSSCHNVHGAAGAEGSTNEPMIRDGSLAGRTGFGFSYVVEDVGIGGYPVVTSEGASLPISVGAVFRNGNVMCSSPVCHMPSPPGPTTTSYDATGSGSGTYLEYYRPPAESTCDTCHAYGTEASHPTHADSSGKGVDLGCFDCHDSDGHVNNTVDLPGGPLADTTVCDDCHSTGGAFGGVTMAKDNWADGIYESDGVTLQSGKEQWCAGCHDDEGANSMYDGTGITAPNVMGDSAQETYGYYVCGHGRPSANLTCDVCHDLTKTHIDHDPRTYDVDESSVLGNDISTYVGKSYRKGYRLKAGLDMPRNSYDDAYWLCTNCHQAVMGTKSNFADVGAYRTNLHGTHIGGYGSLGWGWDSDGDGVPVGGYIGDSFMSCTGCHNVHGPPMEIHFDGILTPNRVMIRYGELMDAEPGLNFRWYTGDSYYTGIPTDKRNDSLSGNVNLAGPFCGFTGCHSSTAVYSRPPYTFLPGFLVDDFESYGDDADLQVNWKNKYDAKPAFIEADTGPDGSQCMRVRVKWDRNAEDHGYIKRVYSPYVQTGYMQDMSFQVMVVNTAKIVGIGVMLQVYPDETYHEYFIDTAADLEDNVWEEITIPLSSFGIGPFDKVSEVRFHFYEASPTELWDQNVYLDDIRFTPPSYTVSGEVTEDLVGLGGVIMRGFPGDNVVTGGDGTYTGTVYDIGYGWTGTITPEKPGYFFEPVDTPYADVTSNLTDQDYTASPDTSAIISESFEGIGYEEEDWSESVGENCALDKDYSITLVPGEPPVDFGSECLQSVSDDTGYKARADLDYGYSYEQPRTYTTFYVYVDGDSLTGLIEDELKNIGAFLDNWGEVVAILRLYRSVEGDLKFMMRRYNNGVYNNFYSVAIPPDDWYKIQFMYDASDDVWEWRVNGEVQEGSGALTGTLRTGIRQWRLGFWQSGQTETGTLYFDNFTVGVGTYVGD